MKTFLSFSGECSPFDTGIVWWNVPVCYTHYYLCSNDKTFIQDFNFTGKFSHCVLVR